MAKEKHRMNAFIVRTRHIAVNSSDLNRNKPARFVGHVIMKAESLRFLLQKISKFLSVQQTKLFYICWLLRLIMLHIFYSIKLVAVALHIHVIKSSKLIKNF